VDALFLIVRLVGLGFAAHGAQKLFGWFGGHGLAGTGGFFEGLGWHPGRFFAGAAGLGEFLGGLLLFLGLGGPIGPMLIIAVMVVAAISVHWPAGWFAPNGIELPVVYIALAMLFAFLGFGAYSLDALFGLTAYWTMTASWLAVAIGVLAGLATVALRHKPKAAPAES
jgi:putative oxidoreductase